MTSQEYLQSFQRHLRVAEPKRSEIIAEIKTHLFESQNSGDFGDPKRLAARYNRTHIGFWYSEFKVSVTLVLWCFANTFAHLLIIDRLRLQSSFTGNTPLEITRDLTGILGIIGPIILSIWFAFGVFKIQKPLRVFWNVMLIGLLTSMAITALDQYDESMFQLWNPVPYPSVLGAFTSAFLLSLFKILPFVVIATLTTIIASPPIGTNRRFQLSFIRFQMLLSFFFVILSFIFIGFITESLHFQRSGWIYSLYRFIPLELLVPCTIAILLGYRSIKQIRNLKAL